MAILENPPKDKMKHILESNNWSSPYSLTKIDGLDSKRKGELCTIVFDGFQKQPEVLEVLADVFKDRIKISAILQKPNEISLEIDSSTIETLEICSNKKLIDKIREARKEGSTTSPYRTYK